MSDREAKFSPTLKQLEPELRDYQLPDQNVNQGSVMSLAIALDFAAEAQGFQAEGRIMRDLFREANPPVMVPANIPGASLPWTTPA